MKYQELYLGTQLNIMEFKLSVLADLTFDWVMVDYPKTPQITLWSKLLIPTEWKEIMILMMTMMDNRRKKILRLVKGSIDSVDRRREVYWWWASGLWVERCCHISFFFFFFVRSSCLVRCELFHGTRQHLSLSINIWIGWFSNWMTSNLLF